MFSVWQLIGTALTAAAVSWLICSLIWRRWNDELADAWAQDHLRLDDRIEELETELDSAEVVTCDPMDSEELISAVEAFVESPTAYTVEKWQTPFGLSVVIQRKEAMSDAEADP